MVYNCRGQTQTGDNVIRSKSDRGHAATCRGDMNAETGPFCMIPTVAFGGDLFLYAS